MACDFKILLGDKTQVLGDATNPPSFTTKFDTPSARGDAVLTLMLKGLTYAEVGEAKVTINSQNVGGLFPVRLLKDPIQQSTAVEFWTMQTVAIGEGVLNPNSANMLEITAAELPDNDPGKTIANWWDDFYIRDVVLWYHVPD